MLDIVLYQFDLEKIANSGQCFRIEKIEENSFLLIALQKVLHIEYLGSNYYRFYCNEDDFYSTWYEYFDLGTDYTEYSTAIDDKDTFLKAVANTASGIRILKQDPWEMIVSFIISQRKSIPAIKKCIQALCELCGTEIDDHIFTFPTPEKVAQLSIEELNSCGLGYRSKYILNTAQKIINEHIDLYSFASLSDEDLLEQLQRFSGVGVKVANCIMLFAYHRISAFPVDVWIQRILDKEYNGAFPIERYKGFAGILQQYMFYHAIQNK